LLIFESHAWAQFPNEPVSKCNVKGLQVDDAVRSVMRRDDVPSVSLAIVCDGEIAYLRAYGFAALPINKSGPELTGRAAEETTRFAIGSVSKEFTAAAILLLADRGKLSLDDTVAKYLPTLTDANKVTIRQLLSHTSGYRDYFFEEYIPARMQQPTSVDTILKTWAQRPLDFPPGQQWQYSSTNYVIAGRIVEIVSGQSYERFLTDNILRPVGITDATFVDHAPEAGRDAVGYFRVALGRPRPAPRTGRNWLFAMADLEMTAKDVALWDISVMNQSLLSAEAYQAMTAETKTSDGKATGYGLGFFVTSVDGSDGRKHRMLHHPGETSGFRSHNFILPELKTAVVILTNAEYSDATREIAEKLQGMVGLKETAPVSETAAPGAAAENAIESRARRLVTDLAHGRVDHADFSPDALAVFTPEAVRDIQESLAPLGELRRVRLDSTQLRGGTSHHALTLLYAKRTLQIAEYDLPDGKIAQFFIDDKD
jgi:CubicO group peptidase (beta-lactamase class C family)